MATEITVRGSSSVFKPPERGTVHAAIAFEGALMQPVYDGVAHALESVQASITLLHDRERGPVTWWTAEQLRTWSNRPWNNEGRQLPLVHHASVAVQARFRDFAALTRWVGEHTVGTEGFRVAQIEWVLTQSRRDELQRQVHQDAVRDAVARAQHYADALDLGQVRPTALADAGMLGGNSRPDVGASSSPYMRAMAVPAGEGAAPDVELVPQAIEVSASVDVRFVAGD